MDCLTSTGLMDRLLDGCLSNQEIGRGAFMLNWKQHVVTGRFVQVGSTTPSGQVEVVEYVQGTPIYEWDMKREGDGEENIGMSSCTSPTTTLEGDTDDAPAEKPEEGRNGLGIAPFEWPDTVPVMRDTLISESVVLHHNLRTEAMVHVTKPGCLYGIRERQPV